MKTALLLLLAASAITGCKKDDETPATPAPVNENEVLTTLRITFVDQGSGPVKVWEFRDVDGDGGAPPTITADTLLTNAAYHASLLLLNESVSPVDTASHEVWDENTLHQFFYQVNGANIAFTYADADDNGHPVGLTTDVSTTDPSTGTVKVTLRHEPDKGAPGVAAGNITNAGGSTDLEVTFPAVVH
ncbi:MAG: type 1 periplasmic binding fold superfamily protein [Bacteroidetes bacterium]|nr:type 1 periplasmic binding fold superfamily protein [Bacteroidota bacterium]